MSFLTIGHRGLMGVEPENTLRSFRRADRERMDAIELDLHLSKDGHLVVMHDADVDRTTDGQGPIADFTLEEIRRLDAGGGERVPVFSEVVEAVRVPLHVEIKDVAAAKTLADTVTAMDLAGRVTVVSFHDEAVDAVHKLLPHVPTVLVGSHYGPDVVDRALAVGAGSVSLNIRRLTLELSEQAREAGLRVLTWTVNTPEHLKIARGMGVQGVYTDFPEIKHAALFTA